jgi:hypothetical protein
MPEIHVQYGALEDDEYFDRTCLRGRIDQDSIKHLQADWYQRVQGFSDKEIRELCEAYFARYQLADITIGMRGHRYRQDHNSFWLADPCFTVDGGQRVFAAKVALERRPDLRISLGVKVYFDTDVEFENKMFCAMNATQQRVSPTVLIRNKFNDSPSVQLLYKLNTNHDFALKDMVGWDQKNQEGEFVTGFGLTRVTGALHMHKGGTGSGRSYDLLAAVDKACCVVGPDAMQTSVIRFFDAVDQAWGIRGSASKPACLNLRILIVLARLFASYDDFWDGNEFLMPTRYEKKLAKIDVRKIKQQLDAFTDRDNDMKDVLLELFRNKLGLNKRTERPPPDTFDTDDGARPTI